MKTVIGIPVWEGRVATTFDFANTMVLVTAEDGRELERREVPLDDGGRDRIGAASQLDVLLCGAISRPAWRRLRDTGVRVVPFVSGEVDEVLAAWFGGRLDRPCYRQPGCGSGTRRRWRHGAGGCRRFAVEDFVEVKTNERLRDTKT